MIAPSVASYFLTVKRRLGQSPVLTRISLSLVEKVFEPADWTSRFPLLGGGSDNLQFLHVENGLVTYFCGVILFLGSL